MCDSESSEELGWLVVKELEARVSRQQAVGDTGGGSAAPRCDGGWQRPTLRSGRTSEPTAGRGRGRQAAATSAEEVQRLAVAVALAGLPDRPPQGRKDRARGCSIAQPLNEGKASEDLAALDDSIQLLQRWNSLTPEARAHFLGRMQAEFVGPPRARASGGLAAREQARATHGEDGQNLQKSRRRQRRRPTARGGHSAAEDTQGLRAGEAAQGPKVATPTRLLEEESALAARLAEVTRLWQELQGGGRASRSLQEVLAAHEGGLKEAQADLERFAGWLRSVAQAENK